MSIAISDEHAELASTMRSWAASLDGSTLARAAEGEPGAAFADAWKGATDMGLPLIAVAESSGGGGGGALDLAVVLEACAHELVPGALLGPTVAAGVLERAGTDDAHAALAGLAVGSLVTVAVPTSSGLTVLDAPGAEQVIAPVGDAWHLLPADALDVESCVGPDLTRRYARGTVTGEGAPLPSVDTALVRRLLVTALAAEASGTARWCLATAVDYAQVREQFGRPIGSFQAVKHLCVEMLETCEAITAAAWDVSAASAAGEQQWSFAADVAAVVCLDGAVDVAKTCIQVLGGIGFTFEHDAHLYLRRALASRALVPGSDTSALALADRAAAGVRREVEVDLEGRDAPVRPGVREDAERIAALPDGERRAALVESGLLTPHWPTPYGRAADAVTQLVIDQELARVGVTRPDLVIAAWAVPTILEHGTEAQRERFVRPSLLGELVWCQLFSEPGSGSDLASLRTKAVRVDGGWRLTGQKVWTSMATQADWAICLARTDPDAPQHQGITYFLVDMAHSDGLDVRPLREITGEALFNEVFLDDVFVPDECVVAAPGDGWRLARTTLANERVAMATVRLSSSTERAVEIAAEQELSIPEMVEVGRSVALATVCSLLSVRSTLRRLAGQGPGAESSVSKLLGVRSRQDASELVVRLRGDGLLFADTRDRGEDPLGAEVWEQLNTRCLSIAGGTTQILRNVAGERLLGLPR
ncbi:acyl-CoA dehydrogenase [Nocardioides acrostichi]|uniref:Acyl-CoA dehydrogenase n=1 Tax=Nocardioides acrostichi TaxID=2784339 RepID=A0A930UWH1_9ACTN|nr:acyl-CoA dehydrogenase [Nocardioides acrostichi]MBF4162133.1 acyl-CoA dehydrogenase [Nocardioides acrostichi]